MRIAHQAVDMAQRARSSGQLDESVLLLTCALAAFSLGEGLPRDDLKELPATARVLSLVDALEGLIPHLRAALLA